MVLFLPPSTAVYQGPFEFIAVMFNVGLFVITPLALFGGFGFEPPNPEEFKFFAVILGFLSLFALGMLYFLLRGRFGKTHVLIAPGRLVRQFDLFGWKRLHEYELDDESCASLVSDFALGYGDSSMTGSDREKERVYHVHVTTTDQPAKFGSYLSDEEKQWLVSKINKYLCQRSTVESRTMP